MGPTAGTRFALVVTTDDDLSTPPAERLRRLVGRAVHARDCGFDDVAVTHRHAYREDEPSPTAAQPTSRFQPLPTLAHLAGIMGSSVGYLTSVLLSAGLHPVQLAEDIATLDAICHGQLRVGVGLGWTDVDLRAFGVDRAHRAHRFEELLTLTRALLSGCPAHLDGDFYPARGATLSVRTIQQPHPPIWVGATSEAGVKRAARLGDSWVMSSHTPVGRLEQLRRLHDAVRGEADRPPAAERPLLRTVCPGDDDAEARTLATRAGNQTRHGGAGAPAQDTWIIGGPQRCSEELLECRRLLDVTQVVVLLPRVSEEERRRMITLLGDAVLPAVRAAT